MKSKPIRTSVSDFLFLIRKMHAFYGCAMISPLSYIPAALLVFACLMHVCFGAGNILDIQIQLPSTSSNFQHIPFTVVLAGTYTLQDCVVDVFATGMPALYTWLTFERGYAPGSTTGNVNILRITLTDIYC